MIELKQIYALTTNNPHNLNAQLIIEISLVLQSAHVIFKAQNMVVFYINNYIDWN